MPNIASLANDNNNTSNNTNNSQEEENKSEQNIQEITSSITARYVIICMIYFIHRIVLFCFGFFKV